MAEKPVIQHTFLRGRSLLHQGELEDAIASSVPSWDLGFQLGPFRICSDDATKHIAIVGAPGSGKTVLMRLMMQSVLPLVNKPWKGAISEEVARDAPREIDAEHIPVEDSSHSLGTLDAIDDPVCDELLAKFNGSPVQLLAAVNHSGWDTFIVSTILVFVVGAVGSWLFGLWFWSITPLIPILVVQNARADRKQLSPYLSALGPDAKAIIRRYAEAKLNPATIAHEPQVVQDLASQEPPDIPYDGPYTWDKHRAFVYDAKLEVLPQLAGMDLHAPVIVLNPFDQRSVAWDMAVDITEPATAKQVAAIFIPEEKKASQPFFSDAARQLLEGVMVAFILTRPHQWSLRDVLIALKSASRLTDVLSSTPVTKDLVETYLSNERESKSIIATISTKLGPLDVVAALWDSAETKVSLR
ncbi:MAG: type IV secretion system DNA-binding domain-containing protein, partial [Fimbriimonadaceae bacterium]|nr:type IV secretion system DNA-binding domain-containing protein [Fimbriimonadaceae bacterium]